MPTIHPVDRGALLAEIQAIPDGTFVHVGVKHSSVEPDGERFSVTGPIYTPACDSTTRYVGDTLVTLADDDVTRVGHRITTVRRLTAPSSAGLDVQRAATRAGMDLK